MSPPPTPPRGWVATLRVLLPAMWSLFVVMARGDVARVVRSKLTVSRVGGGGSGGSSANRRTNADDGVAYVDGSCAQGVAGIGVWYGTGHGLNYAAAIPTTAADNNVAELVAVFFVLIRHPRDKRLVIHTDSKAAMTALESLSAGAKPKRLAPHHPARRALLTALQLVLFWRNARTVVHKIKGHNRQTPNERADQLASLGANSSFVVDTPGFGDGRVTKRSHSGKEKSHGIFPTKTLQSELIRFLACETAVGAGAIGTDHASFVAKKPKNVQNKNGFSPRYKGPLAIPKPIDGNFEIANALAIDCEMVGTGIDGEKSVLAQVSVVNESGNVVYTSYASTTKKVTDYRTFVSGITPKHMAGAPRFESVQDEVRKIIAGRIVIGHALENDFEALQLKHPVCDTRDTAHWRPFLRMGRFSKRLKHLARDHLGLKIQGGAHDPAEDARAAMYLYLKYKDNWEGQVWATRQGRDQRGRVYHY